MASTAAEIRQRDLLGRLAAGTAGVVGAAFLRRLVPEQVFAARAAAELERRRHERALRLRADEVLASRSRAVHAADEERRRISRDLHDGAQQRLVVLGQALDLALRELERDPERARERLIAAREQASVAGRELRELARGLHPVGLDRGLHGAFAALAAQSPLPLLVDALPERRLPAVVETTTWFLVSEALSNAIKHAEAKTLRVEVVLHGRTLLVTVADDGNGGACPTRGTGLQGLAARVESLGGRLNVESLERQGTTLTATIPLARWRAARARAYDECRDEIAALLREPDWDLTDAEPMVVLN